LMIAYEVGEKAVRAKSDGEFGVGGT